MVLFHLFFLLHPIIWPRIMVIIDLFIDLFILFAHDHLTNIYGPLSFALSFEKDHSTKYMVFYHLFFLQWTTIPPKIRVLIDLFLLSTHDHSTKYMFLFHLFFLWHMTTWPKHMVLFYLSFLLQTTIRPKIKVLINLFHLCTRPFDQNQGSLLLFNLFFS